MNYFQTSILKTSVSPSLWVVLVGLEFTEVPKDLRDHVHVIDHPYAQAVLTILRDRGTGQIDFRKGLVRLGRVIGLEMVKYLDGEVIEVETPLGVKAKGFVIKDMNYIVVITVLRAAMPLAEGLVKIFPKARQGVVSARRIEEGVTNGRSFEIELNYVKIPKIRPEDTVIIADPMLATGSTMLAIIPKVLEHGVPKRLFIASVISTEYGIRRVLSKYPETHIFTVAIDPELNSKGYIVPGLGDAGDRAFGTTE